LQRASNSTQASELENAFASVSYKNLSSLQDVLNTDAHVSKDLREAKGSNYDIAECKSKGIPALCPYNEKEFSDYDLKVFEGLFSQAKFPQNSAF